MRVFMTGFEAGYSPLTISGGSLKKNSAVARSGDYYVDLASHWFAAKTPALPGMTECYIRFAITRYTYGCILETLNSSGGRQLALSADATQWYLRRDNAKTGTILASGGTMPSGWMCIELHMKIDSTTGIFELRVNGVDEVAYYGNTLNTSPANISTFNFGASLTGNTNSNGVAYLDDIAINDTSGSCNNSWVGQGGIRAIVPTSAGTYTEFTPSAGSNYACVDEIPHNSDTDYVYTTSTGARDLYTMSDLPASAQSVTAVQFYNVAKIDIAGGGSVATLVRSGGTDYQFAAKSLDVSYTTQTNIANTNPVTGNPWTVSEINALEVGVITS